MSDIHADGKSTEVGERFLSFSLGAEEYGMPLLKVREVIAMPEITPIPFTPTHFLGIMNLRGQVISILDLRTKFNIKPKNSEETSVIICDIGGAGLGVVVDSVNSVIAPKMSEMSEKPDIDSKKSDIITGVYRKDKKLILLLDVNKALSTEDQMAMQKAKKAA